MKVELRTDKQGLVWATGVDGNRRFHLTCMGSDIAEALRVALNARHAEKLRAERRKKGAK